MVGKIAMDISSAEHLAVVRDDRAGSANLDSGISGVSA
jgi:hypothetical protein